MNEINRSTGKLIPVIAQWMTAIFFFPYIISCTGSRSITREVKYRLLNDSAIRQGHIGISIYEPANGKYWYNHNADKYFIPASNTKLYTLYAGLKFLGDSLPGIGYMFEKENNITHLFPTGDPSFLDPRFNSQPVLEFLRQQKKIRIHLSNGPPEYGMGWAWDDHSDSYMKPLTEFPIYGNEFFIEWKSADSLSFSPHYFSGMANRAGTFPKGFGLAKKINENQFQLFDGRTKKSRVPFSSDSATVVGILRDQLSFTPELVIEKNLPEEQQIIRSRPSDSLFKPMMEESDNYYAEQTLLMISRSLLGRMNESALIDTLTKLMLNDLPEKPKWVDGSGLSRYNLFTPKSFIYILNKLSIDFGRERILKLLPTGGQGTLKTRFLSDSAYVFAKTGTLSNNCALSGFLVTKSGKWLIFSILVNHYRSGATPVRHASDRFLVWLRENY